MAKINTKEREYIPKADGNDKLPEKEQIRMFYLPEITFGAVQSLKNGFDESLEGLEYEKQLVEMIVVRFENFELNDRIINSGHEIYDKDMPANLFTELRATALKGYLNTELEKNSEEQSHLTSTKGERTTTAPLAKLTK